MPEADRPEHGEEDDEGENRHWDEEDFHVSETCRRVLTQR